MVNYLKLNYKAFLIACITFAFCSCQDDFVEIGSNLVDDVNYASDSLELPVTAYNRSFINGDGVQTNNLASGAIGIYNNPVYGQTVASTVSQLSVVNPNVFVGDSVVVDSVIVSLPYYSTPLQTTEEDNQYRLDSVYGEAPMNLRFYRSNYFLSNVNPENITENAVYYSNQLAQFNGLRGEELFSVEDFTPSAQEIEQSIPPSSTSTDSVNTIQRSAPALRIKLDSEEEQAYWKNTIIDRVGTNALANQNSFSNYFRGLYIEAEPINDDGSYFLFNRAESEINIYYTSIASNDTRVQSSITLSMNPNANRAVVGYSNDFDPTIVSALSQTDSINGDERLYLKGGQGSMAVIDLFGPDLDNNGIADRLEELRARDISIIREAHLTFYVDQETLSNLGGGNALEPERLYVYNLDNNQFLRDYPRDSNDPSAQNIAAVGITHLEPLTRDAEGNGVYYRIRITEHMRDLLNPENQSPNTKLGLVVAENVLPSGIRTNAIQNASANDIPSRLPVTTILSQQGTILHGNDAPDASKRLSLQLYFIETPNQ